VTATAKVLLLLIYIKQHLTTNTLQYWWHWQTAQGMLTVMVTAKIQEKSESNNQLASTICIGNSTVSGGHVHTGLPAAHV